MLSAFFAIAAVAVSCVSVFFYKRSKAATAESKAASAELTELQTVHSQLCELVAATNDRAAHAEETLTKITEQLNTSSQRFQDFRNELKNNTDLELATIDQIIGELKNRKSRFLLLRPGVNDGIDAVASQVSKHDAISVLRVALAGLKGNEFGQDEEEDWSS